MRRCIRRYAGGGRQRGLLSLLTSSPCLPTHRSRVLLPFHPRCRSALKIPAWNPWEPRRTRLNAYNPFPTSQCSRSSTLEDRLRFTFVALLPGLFLCFYPRHTCTHFLSFHSIFFAFLLSFRSAIWIDSASSCACKLPKTNFRFVRITRSIFPGLTY